MQKLIGKWNSLMPRLIWQFFPLKIHQTTYPVKKVGNSYGFSMIPDGLIDADSIVYSFGAGEDIHADLEMVKQYGCEVIIFDPTPRAITHFQQLQEKTLAGETFFSDGKYPYKTKPEILKKIKFKAIALWNEDTTVRFFSPLNPAHVSHSITNMQGSDDYIEVPAQRLSSIMKNMKHRHIDYLKLDIEGAEYEVIQNIIDEQVDIKIIYLEFHHTNKQKHFKNIKKIHQSLSSLITYGFQIVHNDANRYFVLVNRGIS